MNRSELITNYYITRYPEIESRLTYNRFLAGEDLNKNRGQIEDPRHSFPISQRVFAWMFGDTFIWGTGHEGGDASDAADYYLRLLAFWKQSKFPVELSQKVVMDIENDIVCFQKSSQLIENADLQGLKQLIRDSILQNGRAVTRIQLKRKDGTPYGCFCCVFEQNERGELSFYFLNRGNTGGIHPLIKQSPLGKEYFSYRSYSYVISDQTFLIDSSAGNLFFQRIIDFNLHPNDGPPVETSEPVYQDLTLFADQEKTLERLKIEKAKLFDTDDISVTPLRSDTSPEQAIRLILRDNLHRNGTSREKIRKIIFMIKMQGLRNGCHSLSFEDKENAWLLEKAAQGLSIQASKLYEEQLLDSTILEQASNLIDFVLEKTSEIKPLFLDTNPNRRSFIVKEIGFKRTQPKLEFRRKMDFDDPHLEFVAAYRGVDKLIEECLETPKAIPNAVEEILRIVESDNDPVGHLKLLRSLIATFILNLPTPEYQDQPTDDIKEKTAERVPDNDPFARSLFPEDSLFIQFDLSVSAPSVKSFSYWDQVPEAESHEIIKSLVKLVDTYFNVESCEENDDALFKNLVFRQTAAIVHKILCNDPHIGREIKQFPFKIALSGNTFTSYYLSGSLEAKNCEIEEYFRNTEKNSVRIADTAFAEVEYVYDIKKLINEVLIHSTIDGNYWSSTILLYKKCLEQLGFFNSDSDERVGSILKAIVGYINIPTLRSLNYLHSLIYSSINKTKELLMPKLHPGSKGILTNSLFSAKLGLGNKNLKSNRNRSKADKDLIIPCHEKIISRELAYLLEILKFKKLYQNQIEQKIIIHTFDSIKFEKDIFEEFLRMQCAQIGRIPLLIDWCKEHSQMIVNKEIRILIESALFRDSIIKDSWDKRPYHIKDLRAFIDEILEGSAKNLNQVSDTLFWMLLSIHIESRMKQHDYEEAIHRIQAHQLILSDLRAILLQKDPELALNIAIYQKYLISLFPDELLKEPEIFFLLEWDILTLRKNNVKEQIYPFWMDAPIKQLTVRCLDRFDRVEMPLPALNNLLEIPPETVWQISYPHACYDGYIANPLMNSIVNHNNPVSNVWPAWVIKSPHPFIEHLKQNNKFIIEHNDCIRSLTGSFSIIKEQEEVKITHYFEINGKHEQFWITANLHTEEWLSMNDESRGLKLGQDFLPAFLLRFEDKIYTMQRIEGGKTIDEFRCPNSSTEWWPFFEKITSDQKMETYVRKNSEGVWQVSKFVISDLEFELELLNGSPRLACSLIPDYYISNDQWEGGILSDNALWLEDEKGIDRQAIIFDSALESSRDVNLKIKPKSYLIFELDVKRNRVVGTTPKATLYLILLYFNQSRYSEACEVLQNMNHFGPLDDDERTILNKIVFSEKDRSPQATALKIQAQLYSLQMQNRTVPTHDKLVKWFNTDKNLKKLLKRYQSFVGNSVDQRIPGPLRLPKQLLDVLRFKYDNFESKLFPSHSCFVEILKQPEPLYYHVFGAIPEDLYYYSPKFPPFPSSEFYWLWHFRIVQKCELAKFPDQIDLDLLALHRSFLQKSRFNFAAVWLYRKTLNRDLKETLIENQSFASKTEELKMCFKIMKNKIEDLDSPRISMPIKVLDIPQTQEKHKVLIEPLSTIPADRLNHLKKMIPERCDITLEKKILSTTSPLAEIDFKTEEEIANQLIRDLEEAHSKNCKETYPVYNPKNNLKDDAEFLLVVAKDLSFSLHKEARDLLNDIESEANWPNDEAIQFLPPEKKQEVLNYRLKHKGNITQKLTLRNPLLMSLLMRDSSFIQAQNPFINENQMTQLLRKVALYLYLVNEKKHADAAVDAFEKCIKNEDANHFSKGVALICSDREYDPASNPDLALYEYATGFRLRPEQVEILQWIFDHAFEKQSQNKLQQICFEFQAGGGKTKVIAAILAARAHSYKKIPIFFSIPHLEEITCEDLKESLALVVDRKLSRIHLSIHDKLDEDTANEIFDLFKLALVEKRTIIMSPETWHALNLARKSAVRSNITELIEVLDPLFTFMQENGVALIDESHLNADSLFETNRAKGVPFHIPRRERKIFVRTIRILMEDPLIKNIVMLGENKQASMLSQHVPKVRERVAEQLIKLVQKDLNNIPDATPDSLMDYWLNPDKASPDWMRSEKIDNPEDLHKELFFRRINLIRGILNTVLPFTLKKSNQLDYQPPRDESNEIWVPAKQGFATQSQFQNPDVAALITCQGLFQNGLSKRQMRKFIEQLLDVFLIQKTSKNNARSVEKDWKRILKESQIEKNHRFTLEDYYNSRTEDRELLLDRCFNKVRFNFNLIGGYLIKEVFSHLKIFPIVEQSTATNLVQAFATSILFSATLGIDAKYPLKGSPSLFNQFKTAHRRDLQFFDAVMSRAVLPHNNRMYWILESTPYSLLSTLPRNELLLLEGVINVGALCEQASNEEWADALLQMARDNNLDKTAALFRIGNSGDRTLCLKEANQEKVHFVQGSKVGALLKSLKLRNEQVYKIFGPSETTGTDFPISPNANMLLTVGDHIDLSLAIQSIMRMRGFLKNPIDLKECQKIIWIGNKSFHAKLKERFPENDITPAHFFGYALEKESKNLIASIKQQALQEIDATIFGEVEIQRRKTRSINNFITNHANVYEKRFSRNPSKSFGGENSLRETYISLIDYAKGFANDAGIDYDQGLSEEAKSRIEAIAQRASDLIPLSMQRSSINLNATIQQSINVEQQQEQIQEKEEQRAPARVFYRNLFSENAYQLSIFDGEMVDTFRTHLHHPYIEVSAQFSKDLFILDNAYYVIKKGYDGNFNIKHVSFFIVEEVEGIQRAFVISDHDALNFINQIEEYPKSENDLRSDGKNKKLAIFTSRGRLTQNGPRHIGFSESELKVMMDSEWFNNKIAEIGLWNGKIVDKDWILKKLEPQYQEERNNFIKTWDWIKRHQYIKSDSHNIQMEDLIMESASKDSHLKHYKVEEKDYREVIDYPDIQISQMGDRVKVSQFSIEIKGDPIKGTPI